MFLKKAKINGFGKLIDRQFNFTPGMNIVFGPNESGKTTLARFILYTLSNPSNEALKYKPWNGEEFGGFLETSDGTFIFGESSEEKQDKNFLESIAFLMEDDELESLKIDKSIIESSLKKKSEKTEMGRIIKGVMKGLEEFQIDKCVNKISSDLNGVKEEIEKLKSIIVVRNKLYLKKNDISKRLEKARDELENLQVELENLRKKKKEELKNEITKVQMKIDEIKSKLSKLSWVERIDQNVVFEIYGLIKKIDNVKEEIDKLEEEEKSLVEIINTKDNEINSKLKLLGATSEKDLESISLRLKHLSLLSKMYGEGISQTEEEEPLWHIFIQDPSIIERAEDEEQKYQEIKNAIEKEKIDIQNQIEKLEGSAKYSKDLSILSGIAGVVLLALGLLFNKIALFMYLPSVLFLGFAVLLLLKSRNNISKLSVLQEKLVELMMHQTEQPQVWKLLSQYGVKNIRDLRKKYSEFLEWKAANVEKQKKIIELKEIEQEIIKELSKFNVNGYAQMVVSAVENLQRTFNEVQELIYEKETLERKLTQVRGEYVSKQKELNLLHNHLEESLKTNGVSKQDIENYRTDFENYLKLKSELSDNITTLKDLENSLENEDLDREIHSCKLSVENQIKIINELEQMYQDICKKIEENSVNKELLSELLVKKDELEFKLSLINLIGSYIPRLFEHLKDSYSKFVESYYKNFSDEFIKFFNYVSGQTKNFFVTPELSVKILVEGDLKDPSEYLSGSTKDLLIFGIKNALYKSFYDGNIPLVIDNTLIRFDDERLKRICEYLKEESNYRQIILLTSDKRIIKHFHKNTNVLYLEG
ncbi:ATP-binding protein [Fervidobacterium nodosum]|uniref:Rad50/SbcC-type AAA domain-containing protein n=1 Tax=Fervidobacterium nodosum (strain ATCC 35602 / DSM 5306 / Rt17-B1) TaxID=381764 RepID=A7HL99_FERNB|nr:AAA family ATPase [Fervidobacterium nodosum]ABS60682.1 hypothetical protein Fnod_0829 [Fervidobacterium nodosum Rt17-B1]PHJ13605.1 hypothetical protein IM41_05425 [Fervidobacterium sp. SC_NGM5_G05]